MCNKITFKNDFKVLKAKRVHIYMYIYTYTQQRISHKY